MREKPIHVSSDFQTNVEGDGKINKHNFVAKGAIPTIMCMIHVDLRRIKK
jgi:hypothetical protein